jgi:hypothetical protein
MTLLVLALCLATQDQTAEAKKLLDALAPPLKDPPYLQLEWTSVSKSGATRSGVGYFDRGKAWRLDTKVGGGESVHQWDGKTFLTYMKHNNQGFKRNAEPRGLPFSEGGALAEIYYSGNSERLFNEARKVTVTTEKLDNVDCAHVVIFRADRADANVSNISDVEYHVWIADGTCKRYARRHKSKGNPYEDTFTYKVVDPPTILEKTFAFTPPADAKIK